jgi:hypothetical protein
MMTCTLGQAWEKYPCLFRLQFTVPAAHISLVRFLFKENDKRSPAGSQQNDKRVKGYSKVFRMLQAVTTFSLKEFMRFCGIHDINHPESGRR